MYMSFRCVFIIMWGRLFSFFLASTGLHMDEDSKSRRRCNPTVDRYNPFLPPGQFMAPKLIILIKCLIDVLLFKVLF